jgi:hypothetical protein
MIFEFLRSIGTNDGPLLNTIEQNKTKTDQLMIHYSFYLNDISRHKVNSLQPQAEL